MSYDTHYCQLELGVSSQINNYVEKTLAFVIFQLQLTGTCTITGQDVKIEFRLLLFILFLKGMSPMNLLTFVF